MRKIKQNSRQREQGREDKCKKDRKEQKKNSFFKKIFFCIAKNNYITYNLKKKKVYEIS